MNPVNSSQLTLQKQLTCIGKALKDRWSFERVVIDPNKGPRFCRTASSIYQWIPEWILSRLPCLVSKPYRQENRETIRYFESLFGKKRMQDISKRFGLHLEEKARVGAALTRGDVEKIFLGLGEVRFQDVQHLFQVVQARSAAASGLFEEEAVEELQAAFKGKEFAKLTKDDYDQLYSYLVPFKKIKTIFLHNLPTFDSTLRSSGSLGKIRKRVFLCEKIRRQPDLEERIWDAWVAKAFLKRLEKDRDVLIPHPQGYYRVFGEIKADGARYLLMKALQEELPSIVKAQGTRIGFSWDAILSIIDDLLDEVGTAGVEGTIASLLYLLGKLPDCPEGFNDQYRGVTDELFLRSPNERFKGMAFSLGCAQMQTLAAYYRGLFKAFSLACPPGTTWKNCTQYVESESKSEEKCFIRYLMEIDDLVTEGGEAKVGVGCDSTHTNIELVVFSPQEMNQEEIKEVILSPPTLPERASLQLWAFIKAFKGAHVRQTTLLEGESYGHAVFSNQDPDGNNVIQNVLAHNALEELRRQLGNKSVQLRERVVDARMQVTEAQKNAREKMQKMMKSASVWINEFRARKESAETRIRAFRHMV